MEIIQTTDPEAEELNSDECTHIYEIIVGDDHAIFWIGADNAKSAISWIPEEIEWDEKLSARPLTVEEANKLTVDNMDGNPRRMSTYFNEHPESGALICCSEY